MGLQRFTDVDDFLAVVGEFLAAREAEHNLIFGICANLRETPEAFSGAPYLAAVTVGGQVVAAALQTPPFRLVLSEIDDLAAIPALVADLFDRDLPAVLGPVELVRAFVEEWVVRGGPAAHLEESERIYRLTAVRPPRPVPGRPRVAAPGDRELVAAWLEAFMREAFDDADPGRWARRPTAGWPALAGFSTSGRTARPSRSPGSVARRRTGSGSDRCIRRLPRAVEATRAPSSRR